MGYDVTVTGGSDDEGIDVVAELVVGIGAQRIGIQAKCLGSRREVGPSTVRLLRDALSSRECNAGAVVATCRYNEDAKRVAEEAGKPPVELVDADRLTDLALQYGVGARSEAIEAYSEDLDVRRHAHAAATRKPDLRRNRTARAARPRAGRLRIAATRRSSKPTALGSTPYSLVSPMLTRWVRAAPPAMIERHVIPAAARPMWLDSRPASLSETDPPNSVGPPSCRERDRDNDRLPSPLLPECALRGSVTRPRVAHQKCPRNRWSGVRVA